MPILTSSQLMKLSRNLLKAAGASDEEAQTVSVHLMKANLTGMDSHGVLRLPEYVRGVRNGLIKPGADFEVTNETSATALVNGNWGFGQVVCAKAMQVAIQKAKKNGVSAVGIFNCNHIGRLAEYSAMALEHGMISFIVANANPCVAAYGGREPVLSASPLSCAVPAGEEQPIVVDFATSAVAEGKIRTALSKGLTLPEGWIVDSSGRSSTNPADLYDMSLYPGQVKLVGALLPAGGHKGYSLSLVIEALAGALTGTGCDGELKGGLASGVFIMVVKIEHFVPLSSFKSRIDKLIRVVRNSAKAEGVHEILIPGDPERREEERRVKTGILIPDLTWNLLRKACEDYGLDVSMLLLSG